MTSLMSLSIAIVPFFLAFQVGMEIVFLSLAGLAVFISLRLVSKRIICINTLDFIAVWM